MARCDSGAIEEAKPHRRRALSVVPGEGALRRRALTRRPPITSSTAEVAPPAARIAASSVPGDIDVSASSRVSPCLGGRLLNRRDISLGMHRSKAARATTVALVRAQALGTSLVRELVPRRECDPAALDGRRPFRGRSWPDGSEEERCHVKRVLAFRIGADNPQTSSELRPKSTLIGLVNPGEIR